MASSKPSTEDNCTNQPPPILDSNCTSRYEISVAIDFGTSNCAVAYSYESEKENVIVINDWQDGVPTHGKIPTAILFDEDQKFLAFGNRAIKKYKLFVANEDQKKYYFFEKFKMELYKKRDLTENTMLLDQTGKEMKALDVLTASIKYMKEFLLDLLITRGAERKLADNEIAWVITVPAIWNNAAKQLMRRAAEKAGCLHWATRIALEPEAASIYCQNQPNVYFKELLENKNNTKYLVVDIGGGTLDITGHQILAQDHIKEIYRASGNDLGGVKVDQIFKDHLEKLFGKQNITQIQTEHLDEWLQIMEDFEKGKKISQSIEDTLILKTSKICLWDRDYFNKVSNVIKEGNELMKNGNLVVSTKVVSNMVAEVANDIAQHVTKMLEKIELASLDAILLVGGFANSPIIMKAMKNLVCNKNIRVIVPENSELCVVKGAVIFGWKRDIIRPRKSRYTYGIGVGKPFIEGKHDESESYKDNNGKKWCKNCFDKLVTINDDLPIDKCVEDITIHPYYDKEYTTSELYRTEDPNPKYCNVKGVELIGEIKIPRSKEKHGKAIIKHVYFGDTEIYLKITDEATGETYENTFNFLIDVRDVKLLE